MTRVQKVLLSPIVWMALIALPVIGFGWYLALRQVDDQELSNVAPESPRDRKQVVGGVERPSTDVDPLQVNATTEIAPHEPKEFSQLLGVTTCPKTPRLVRGRNRQMDAAIDAVENGTHPERLSPLIAPTPFDRVAWRRDPSIYQAAIPNRTPEKLPDGSSFVNTQNNPNDPGYFDVAEPGRVYDTEQPGEGVPPLVNVTFARSVIAEGEAVDLKIQTLPHAPVSFTAFGMGAFQNGLTSLSVPADAEGVATATFSGTTSPNEVDILAGSPVASGTVRFQVSVVPPAPAGP